jgi:hypothetical protein
LDYQYTLKKIKGRREKIGLSQGWVPLGYVRAQGKGE